MKINRLPFILICCGALLSGKSYADSSKEESGHPAAASRENATMDRPGEGNSPAAAKDHDDSAAEKFLRDKRAGHRATSKSGSVSHAGAIKKAPQPTPTHPDRSEEKPAVHHPGPNKSIANPNQAIVKKDTNHNRERPQSIALPARTSVRVVRGREAQPGALGGPENLQTTAALGGTSFRNRSY
jgi:hypothetical protein